jgi:hypothetical protein
MRTGIAFAKDWQLIKLARSMRHHDVSGPLVRRLVAESPPDLLEDIIAIAGRLGREDGTALLAHASERFEPATLMEGVLLMWGIPCLLDGEGPTPSLLRVSMDSVALQAAFADPRIAVPYLTGYVLAVAPGAAISNGGSALTIKFPDGA